MSNRSQATWKHLKKISFEILSSQVTRILPHSLPESLTTSYFYILSHCLYLLLIVPSRPLLFFFGSQVVHVWFFLVMALQEVCFWLFLLSRSCVILIFMQFICEHILSALAEKCGKNVILVMKYDNKEKKLYSTHGRRQKLFQGGKVDILLIIFRLLTISGIIERVQAGEPSPPGKPM